MGKQGSTYRVVEKMSKDDDKKTLEKFTLLPDRYYIILEKTSEDQFTLSAYDTTKLGNPDDVPCAARVAQEGLLEMLDLNFDRVVKMGIARVALRKGLENIGSDSNVIKVDFGAKQ